MLKLTYSMPDDEFQTVTLLGDAQGIFDLWFRLTNANPQHPTHGVGKITIHDLHGRPIDMRKGLAEAISAATVLSTLGS